jgi:2-amino-4-hydroxy-6-hydroxymethyldihydropteridine diphosphokinase
MEKAVIGMGTNLGDLEDNLLRAARRIDDASGIRLERLSPVYRTEPMGPAVHTFLNAAALVETDLVPSALLALLHECEREAGRPAEHEKWGPRVLDLDILLMGGNVRRDDAPLLPHPGLLERDFALRPLLDLCPDAVDPATGLPLEEALGRLEMRTILSGPHPLPIEVDYALLEHTADAGIEVRAAGEAGLLAAAAMALADAVVPRQRLREAERLDADIAAADMETALVDILQEVIFHLETRSFLPVRADVRLVGGAGIRARASLFGSRVEPSWVRLAVKAATHHDLAVETSASGLGARIWLDV